MAEVEKIQFGENNLPTFTTVTEKNKKRKARYFGDVRFINVDGKVEVKSPARYMFIKNEPCTIYTSTVDAVINEATAKKNLKK